MSSFTKFSALIAAAKVRVAIAGKKDTKFSAVRALLYHLSNAREKLSPTVSSIFTFTV
jgi:hypothetical protein